MLTKKDIKSIKDMMVGALGEFFETVLAPYLDHEHRENQKEHEKLSSKVDLIDEHLKDHKRRISKLEDVANII